MKFFTQLLAALRSPGARKDVTLAAPTQHVQEVVEQEGKEGKEGTTPTVITAAPTNDSSSYSVTQKHRMLDRWLDAVVAFSGSEAVFFILLAGLLTWAFLGIPFHNNQKWQIMISDIQAILSYVFDSLLMRQQLNTYEEALLTAAQLRSRPLSHRRMLLNVAQGTENGQFRLCETPKKQLDQDSFAARLPRENLFGRFATGFSHVLGHIVSIMIFWITVAIWLAFGPANNWSNKWQLDINSATSALMVFIFAFLANIRERHSRYTKTCLDATFEVDARLEQTLRSFTGDKLENDEIIISPPRVNWLQRAIYYYADLVGTLVGIALLIIVMVAWLAIGPVLHFNDNWWLLIGTYAGLIGLNDGFVLRNVQAELAKHESGEFRQIEMDDEKLFDIVKIQGPVKEITNPSLSLRISLAVGRACAHELTVLAGVLLIFGLLAGSSVMRWNTTGGSCSAKVICWPMLTFEQASCCATSRRVSSNPSSWPS
jgi:low-affinity ferrous iron transport protein